MALWKPSSEGGWNPGGASFLVPSGKHSSAQVIDSSGNVVETLTRSPTQEGGTVKYFTRRPGSSFGSSIKIRLDSGEEFSVANPSNRSEGEGNDLQDMGPDARGSMGSMTPGQIGHGFYPADLTGEFPNPSLISDYKPIKAPKFKFIDPMDFAQRYGEFNRQEIGKNFEMSRDMALKQLDTELEGLRSFVPAASALKRSEISLDNLFNQEQRTRQIQGTLPEIRGQMDAQGRRAETFAEGRVPDSITDRALELNVRSAAADQAAAGGFGASSSVSRKVSDLMSADQRIKLSQYGDQLLSQNVEQKVRTFLAPTEYSDAGAQIKVTPEVGAGRLSAQNLATINQDTLISPTNALSNSIQQREFLSELKLKNRQFNRQMKFNTEQFNASTKNQFALGKFGYQVGLAGAVAGAAQLDSNVQLEIDQQNAAMAMFQEFLEKGQNAQQIKDIATGIGATVPSIIEGVERIISTLTSDDAETADVSVPDEDITPPPEDFSIGANDTQPSTPSDTISDPPEFGIQPEPELTITDTPSFETPELRSFSADTAVSPKALQSSNQAVTKELLRSGNQVLRSAGISSTSMPGYEATGFDNTGAPVYSSGNLLRSANINTGAGAVQALDATLSPMNFLTPEDRSKFSSIADASKDAGFISTLTAQAANRDTNGFINSVLTRFEQPLLNKLTDSPQDRAGLSTAFGAYKLFQNWDKISPAQKSLALASLGIKATKFANGQDLSKLNIIKPTTTSPGLNVGQALSMFQSGVNVYSLVKNWDDYNTINKVAAGVNTASSIASTAKNLNLLGQGTEGLAAGASAGSTGAGAAGASAGGTGASTTGMTLGQGLQTAGGVTAVAAGAYTVYQGWGTGGTKGAINGTIGGSSIVAGLSALGYSNPYTAAAIIAVSVLGNTMKVGKHEDQVARDGVRNVFKNNGVADKDFNITLADGTKANIGVDGRGGMHSVTNPDKLVDSSRSGKDKLSAYDIDYTNDLDYVAGMGGTSLSRILTGGKGTNIDQMGGQIGNATLGNIGYGQEMSKGNFDKLMANQRAVFSQSGIKSKADAYALAEQAAKEGRISATDLVTAQQSFNMIFDGDFDTAQRLMAGRFRGAEVASQTPAPTQATTQPLNITDRSKAMFAGTPVVRQPLYFNSKDTVREANRERYAVSGV